MHGNDNLQNSGEDLPVCRKEAMPPQRCTINFMLAVTDSLGWAVDMLLRSRHPHSLWNLRNEWANYRLPLQSSVHLSMLLNCCSVWNDSLFSCPRPSEQLQLILQNRYRMSLPLTPTRRCFIILQWSSRHVAHTCCQVPCHILIHSPSPTHPLPLLSLDPKILKI